MFSPDDVTIDTRALALLRIGLGTLLITDIILRSRNLSRYYTDNGVVPYTITQQYAGSFPTADLPIWAITSNDWLTIAIFITAALTGAVLITGYKTRITTITAFLLISAIDARNPFVLSYADLLFHLLFMWAIFLPLGERWSLDALRSQTPPRDVIATPWSALILAQMVFMYLSNAYHKLQPDWYWSPNVSPVLFTLDHVTFTQAAVIESFTLPLQIATYAWLTLMVTSPLLFFLRGHPRALFASLFITAHTGMAVTLRIGAFPYIAILGLLLFIPHTSWNTITATLPKSYRTRTVTYCTETGTRINRFTAQFEPSRNTQQALVTTAKLTLAVIITAAIAWVLIIGAVNTTTTTDTSQTATEHITTTMHAFGVHQPEWKFYTANPPYNDTYYVFAATTQTGHDRDVYNNRALTFTRPYPDNTLHYQYQHSYRDRFYMSSLTATGPDATPELLRELAAHTCETNPNTTNIRMYRVNEQITMETRLERENRTRTTEHLGDYSCTTRTEP